MKLENQVASLELAKQLKELGVKQESYWHWVKNDSVRGGYSLMHFRDDEEKSMFVADSYSAYSVAGLGEMLPILYVEKFPNAASKDNRKREHYLSCYREKKNKWICSYTGYEMFDAETEADARAKMLIWSIKNKYLRVEEI